MIARLQTLSDRQPQTGFKPAESFEQTSPGGESDASGTVKISIVTQTAAFFCNDNEHGRPKKKTDIRGLPKKR